MTALTVRYLLSTRRGLATLALAWIPLLLVAALALARVASFVILLYQALMVPLFLQIVLVFVTLVDATALIREEIEDNTLPYLLTRPVSKPAVALSKYVGYLAAALLLLLPPVAASYGVTEAYAGTGFGTDADVLLGFLAATALAVVAYGGLFFFLSVILRKPLFVGLLFGFVWESIVGSLPGSVPKLSLIYYLKSVLKGTIAVGPMSGFVSDVSAPVAAAILLIFAIVMVAFAAFLFQNMEFRQKAKPQAEDALPVLYLHGLPMTEGAREGPTTRLRRLGHRIPAPHCRHPSLHATRTAAARCRKGQSPMPAEAARRDWTMSTRQASARY